MITRDNYEEYLMLEADGELDASSQRELQDFLNTHPELEAERAQWQSLKLQPDPELQFPDKEKLLKPAFTVRKRIIPFTLAAAAAVLLAVILIPQIFNNNPENNQIAHTSQPAKSNQPVANEPVTKSPTQTTKVNSLAVEIPKQKTVKPGPVPAPKPTEERSSEQVAPLYAAVSTQELKTSQQTIATPILVPYDIAAAYEPTQKNGHIGLAPANQEALRLFKDAFDQRVGQVKNIAKNLQESALEIRISKGALNVSF